jgi:hypothetical protein
MSVNEKLMAALFCRRVGVYDDLCQVWRVEPSTNYRTAVEYVVSHGLTQRDDTWYAVGGRNGRPLDLTPEELALVRADEELVRRRAAEPLEEED